MSFREVTKNKLIRIGVGERDPFPTVVPLTVKGENNWS